MMVTTKAGRTNITQTMFKLIDELYQTDRKLLCSLTTQSATIDYLRKVAPDIDKKQWQTPVSRFWPNLIAKRASAQRKLNAGEGNGNGHAKNGQTRISKKATHPAEPAGQLLEPVVTPAAPAGYQPPAVEPQNDYITGMSAMAAFVRIAANGDPDRAKAMAGECIDALSEMQFS